MAGLSGPLNLNVLAKVGKAQYETVTAMIRTIHAQPDQAAVTAQFRAVPDMLTDRFPAAAQMLLDAEPGLTA